MTIHLCATCDDMRVVCSVTGKPWRKRSRWGGNTVCCVNRHHRKKPCPTHTAAFDECDRCHATAPREEYGGSAFTQISSPVGSAYFHLCAACMAAWRAHSGVAWDAFLEGGPAESRPSTRSRSALEDLANAMMTLEQTLPIEHLHRDKVLGLREQLGNIRRRAEEATQ